jgi:hypothetical protein
MVGLIGCLPEEIRDDDGYLVVAKCLNNNSEIVGKAKVFVQGENDKGRLLFNINIGKIFLSDIGQSFLEGLLA